MEINEMHDILYEILLVIDEICKKNRILYTLDGGTEIGAVREKDFIPWDDDMDICILAEDYQTFRMVFKEQLPDHLHLVEPEDFSPWFYDFVIRISDDRWLMRKETETDIAYGNQQNRVSADIILYCGIPRSKLGQREFFLFRRVLFGMGMHYRYSIDWKKYTRFQTVLIKILMTLGRIYSGKTPDRIIKLHNKLLTKFDANKTGNRCSGNGSIQRNYEKTYKNEWFLGTVDGQIRNRKFPIKVGYDEEMKCKYGDYMTPEYDTEKYIYHGVSEKK